MCETICHLAFPIDVVINQIKENLDEKLLSYNLGIHIIKLITTATFIYKNT